jgi:protocatechuate 3,4-dioxygenase beta subunit
MTRHHHHDDEVHDHDRGLAFDLETMMGRRRVLQLFAGAGLAGLLAACGDSGGGTTSTAAEGSTAAATTEAGAATTAAGASTSPIPEETAGPFPGDGSNGVNVLTQSGIVRSDIRSSFGASTTTAAGVPLDIAFTVTDAATGRPLSGAAVYVWHCDQVGNYSLYSSGVEEENYLRGVQTVGDDGTVVFTSIFPGAYSGRWPHVHFEVYPSLDEAVAAGSPKATSQIALPEDACQAAYATSGYEQSVANLAQTSLETDMVFSDGWEQELGTVTGTAANGMKVALNVPV